MSFLRSFVAGVPLPPVYRVQQRFDAARIADVPAAVVEALGRVPDLGSLDGRRVGVAAGSRGIDGIDTVARTVVAWVRDHGGRPFIIPAMGSHGGATPAGQEAILRHYGITAERTGAPVESSMATRVVAEVYGRPVHWSEAALAADHLIVINRVKPHTAFRGERESGVTKMVAIGLGKREGAETLHGLGMHRFAETIPAFADAILRHAPPITGLALVENAYHQLCHVEAMPSAAFVQREPALLRLARRHMPRFPVDRFDVLVVDEIGKSISGDGMDPNITGRYPVSHVTGGPAIGKVVVLGLTAETDGNGNGIGLADFTTQTTVDAIDWELTSVNALSGMTTTTIKRPLAAASAAEAVKAAIKTANADPHAVSLIRIRNTLELSDILVSPALADTLSSNDGVEIVGGPVELLGAELS